MHRTLEIPTLPKLKDYDDLQDRPSSKITAMEDILTYHLEADKLIPLNSAFGFKGLSAETMGIDANRPRQVLDYAEQYGISLPSPPGRGFPDKIVVFSIFPLTFILFQIVRICFVAHIDKAQLRYCRFWITITSSSEASLEAHPWTNVARF